MQVEDEVNGQEVLAEYARLRSHILASHEHTERMGDATVVRGSLYIPEGADIVQKVRGGSVGWDEQLLGQPCTRVDNNPYTYDRISVERRVMKDGRLVGTSSIIYGETTEVTRDGQKRLVLEKLERYSQESPLGPVVGERYVLVGSPDGEVLSKRHHCSRR